MLQNPFGDAKPREQVIAQRVGRTEEDVLKEEVKKEKLQLRLNAAQLEEKKSFEAAVKEIEDQIEAEEDESKKDVLRVEAAARQAKLDALMERFAKVTLETALSGEAPRVSQIRRAHGEVPQVPAMPPVAAPHQYNSRYNPTRDQYTNPHRGGQSRGGNSYQSGGRGYTSSRGGRGYYAPEWARDDPSAMYSRPSHQQYMGDPPLPPPSVSSDLDFYDNHHHYNHQGSGHRQRGRGGARGARGNGGYYEPFPPAAGYSQRGYGGPGRGVGGEIEFDDGFSVSQDRY